MRKQIADLEAKSNRTAEEEAELEQKKRQLTELGNHPPASSNSPAPFNWKPWIIGTVVCLVIGIIVYFSRQKKQK